MLEPTDVVWAIEDCVVKLVTWLIDAAGDELKLVEVLIDLICCCWAVAM